MDDLQYPDLFSEKGSTTPVLNLIINGWPSILKVPVLRTGRFEFMF